MSDGDDIPTRLSRQRPNLTIYKNTIYCHTVIFEAPPPPADPATHLHQTTTTEAPNGVWTPCGGIPAFIKTLYWNILNRLPENQQAIDSWTGHTYTHGLAHTVGGIFTSEEYTSKGLSVETTVDRFYLSVLGRGAEPSGKEYWVGKIRSGMSLWQVASGFIGSEEYRAKVRAGTAPDPIH